MMNKIVVCTDSFKGSLSAQEATKIIANEIRKIMPGTKVIELPLADGGEGTAQILYKRFYPTIINVKAHDPLGRTINSRYYLDNSGTKAFIESAEIIGLPLLKTEERNPLKTSSVGLGEIIKKAIENGCKEITVSLGGSATCDGGQGMLEALNETYKGIKFKIICDVNNPLLGENGAVKIFAPQKGAKKEDLPILDEKLHQFVEQSVVKGYCKKEDAFKQGAGAAGGLGFAFMTYLNGELINGIEYILNSLKFREIIKDADLIITGEGKIDKQSLMGKVISGVLKECLIQNKNLIAISGSIEDNELLLKAGIKNIYSIANPNLTMEENMDRPIAKYNLKRTVNSIFSK